MAAPTLSPVRVPENLADKYYQLTLHSLLFVQQVQTASAYLNMGEIAKAQDVLQGAVLDFSIGKERI